MLPKIYRLLIQSQNKRPSRGIRYQGPFFNLVTNKRQIATGQRPFSQFAFIVSRRVSKKAVVRNRSRRLLQEAVRPFLAKVKPDFDVIVLAKPALIERDLNTLKREVEKLFKKAELLKL